MYLKYVLMSKMYLPFPNLYYIFIRIYFDTKQIYLFIPFYCFTAVRLESVIRFSFDILENVWVLQQKKKNTKQTKNRTKLNSIISLNLNLFQ